MPRKTRQVEMLVAETYGNDSGQWHTEFIYIPIETPEDDIEEKACYAWWNKYKKDGRKESIAGLSVYWIPEIEDFAVAYQVLRDIPVPQESGSDPMVIPLGAVVFESDDPAIARTNRDNYDAGVILIEYTPDGVFDARAPYLYSVNMEDLEQLSE